MSEMTEKVGITGRRFFKLGNSIALTLPKEFIESHNIKPGDSVSILYNSIVMLEPMCEERILAKIANLKEAFEDDKQANSSEKQG